VKQRQIKIGNVSLGGKQPVFILGPCVIESEKFVRRMAAKIAAVCATAEVPFIFKGSYDKANRTSVRSFRGLGVREGCQLLAAIGREHHVPVTTDVHSPEEARVAGEFIDVLQIPAFLCRQTDLLRAAAETGRVVNVKKGQFLAPWDLRNIAEKLQASGNEKFFFTERGTTFGYNNLVADMRSLPWIREAGYRVVFDATHSVQRPAERGKRPAATRIGTCAGACGHGSRVRRHLHGSPREPREALSGRARTRFRCATCRSTSAC
jgi:2-dehydro-3-deoxyphosphooctonate aldolase (KDO 8-P synthase)